MFSLWWFTRSIFRIQIPIDLFRSFSNSDLTTWARCKNFYMADRQIGRLTNKWKLTNFMNTHIKILFTVSIFSCVTNLGLNYLYLDIFDIRYNNIHWEKVDNFCLACVEQVHFVNQILVKLLSMSLYCKKKTPSVINKWTKRNYYIQLIFPPSL